VPAPVRLRRRSSTHGIELRKNGHTTDAELEIHHIAASYPYFAVPQLIWGLALSQASRLPDAERLSSGSLSHSIELHCLYEL